jgi:Tol biopolymer transport system component
MTRSPVAILFVTLFLGGCTGGGTTASGSPTASLGTSPSALASLVATPTPEPAVVPSGRILFYRVGSDEMEHYFTVNTDGTNEQALFTHDGCGCARWSPDGTRVWTMGDTGHGTWSFTTMRPDGSDRVVVSPPIETLTLAQAVSNADGRRIAFGGWDDTDPSRNGLYIASPDLADLSLVMAQPEGTKEVEPFGVTPDGSKILFFGETGPDGATTHAGSVFVVNSNGSGLRQLNPPGTRVGFVGVATGSLSPDGRRAAFAVNDAVFVADVDGGEARPITDRVGFVWAVAWSPTGEWITYTRQHGNTSVVSLVHPDGTDQREISANDETQEAAAGAWSPDGTYLLVQRDSDATVDGPRDLWIMDLEGAFIGQVTHQPSTYGIYSWALAAGA